MFERLFARGHSNRAIAAALYERIVAAARQPAPYEHWGVPDTPLGRYEMVALHLFLVLHRLKRQGKAADALGQELTDTFFADMDHSLRELGIGDMGIPKRMKKLARMYLGRTVAYGTAIDSGDADALALALARNIRPGVNDWSGAAHLADYAMRSSQNLATQDLKNLLLGHVVYPQPVSEGVGA